MSLEFTRLSQLTGDPKYYDAIQRISNEFEKSQDTTQLPGLWPVSVDPAKPSFAEDTMFTLGGMSDSLYEYFPKQFLILGGLLAQPKTLYEKFIEVAKEHMFFRAYNPLNAKLLFSGDIRMINKEINLSARTQHLTCFTGGMVGLAAKIFNRPADMAIAEELTQGCIWAYDSGVNGVMPEILSVLPCPAKGDCTWSEATYHSALNDQYPDSTTPDITANAQTIMKMHRFPQGIMAMDDIRYILRPEALESVFLLYRMTGKQIYADAAWRMFSAIEKVSRTKIAAAAIADITIPFVEGASGSERLEGEGGKGTMKTDSMESFWLAETLKYAYLCFEEWDVVSLDSWVLNTEAHPLRRPV